MGREKASHENNPCKKLRVFQGEARAGAEALKQDVLGMFNDYQGGQWGRGWVYTGENKGGQGQRGMGCGSRSVPTLHCTHISSYSECTGNHLRVLCLCLGQSNFSPIPKPKREPALLGHWDALRRGTYEESSCSGGVWPPSKRLLAPAATRPPFSASCRMRVHTDTEGITGHTLAEAAFFPTRLFIQQTFLGLLDMSGASLGLKAPW